jgi:uncharacterized protein (DUF1330 family)
MAAYVVVEVLITNEEEYEKYKPLASASVAAHGGSYKVRGGAVDSLEGDAVEGRIVVLEFPDLERARRGIGPTNTGPPYLYDRRRLVAAYSSSMAVKRLADPATLVA